MGTPGGTPSYNGLFINNTNYPSTSWLTATYTLKTNSTIGFWMYRTDTTTGSVVVFSKDKQNYITFFADPDNIKFYLGRVVNDSATGYYPVDMGSSNINRWIHITITISTSEMKVYVNGTLKTTISTTYSGSYTNIFIGSIQAYYTIYGFTGYVSNFFIANTILPDNIITYIANNRQ